MLNVIGHMILNFHRHQSENAIAS